MTSPFLAEIRIFAGTFAPRGWATCNGQLMPISQNTALFSLLGVTYGGDGRSTYGLPNLAGSAPMQQGQGPGLSQRVLGESGGETTVTLNQTQMPQHDHFVMASNQSGTDRTPQGEVLARSAGMTLYTPPGTVTVTPMATQAIDTVGGSAAHNNLPPYLAFTFIICLQGIFPQRP